MPVSDIDSDIFRKFSFTYLKFASTEQFNSNPNTFIPLGNTFKLFSFCFVHISNTFAP
jgi:hypothetical protein